MYQRKKKNEKTSRHWKNPWRIQRCPKYSENQNSKEESLHHKNKEQKRWMHHLSKRNRRYLWRILQKTLWRQWKIQLWTWNEGWQKNTWNHVWRTTKCNQQTQSWQVSRRKWNTSRRHQRLQRRDERNDEANLQWNHKKEQFHTWRMEESED